MARATPAPDGAHSTWIAPEAGTLHDIGLRVRVVGAGCSSVLLLHGLATSHVYFGAAFDRLGANRRLVVPDLLGFGNSPRPETSDYGADVHADALVDALRRLGIRPPITIAGHSASTCIAVRMAARWPGWVQSVVAFAPPWYRDHEAARARLHSLGFLTRTFALETVWARLACACLCRHRWLGERVFQGLRQKLPRPIVRAVVQHSWTSYSRTLRNLVMAMDPGEVLAAAPVPIHVVVGRSDPIVDVEFLEELARTQAHVRLELWQGGHDLPLALPERCIDLLETVCNECNPAERGGTERSQSSEAAGSTCARSS